MVGVACWSAGGILTPSAALSSALRRKSCKESTPNSASGASSSSADRPTATLPPALDTAADADRARLTRASTSSSVVVPSLASVHTSVPPQLRCWWQVTSLPPVQGRGTPTRVARPARCSFCVAAVRGSGPRVSTSICGSCAAESEAAAHSRNSASDGSGKLSASTKAR